MTVGISSFAFAKNCKNSLNSISKNFEAFSDYKLTVVDCYNAYYLRTEDCDGTVSTVCAGGNAGSCGGEEDNSFIMHVKVQKVCTDAANTSLMLDQISRDFFNF